MSTTTFATTQDYIEQNIAPGLGDIDLTNDQALEVAQRMTEMEQQRRTDRARGRRFMGRSSRRNRRQLDRKDNKNIKT